MSIPLSLSTAFTPLSEVCFKADNFLQCPIEPTNESSDSYPPPFVHHSQNEFVNQEGQRPVNRARESEITDKPVSFPSPPGLRREECQYGDF
jgi:hypothetical protein